MSNSGSAMFSLTEMRPEDPTVSKCIDVTYTGSLDSKVRMYGTTGGTGLAQYLNVKVTRGEKDSAFSGCGDFVADSIAAGDVLVTEAIEAREARPGDIITFGDPHRDGRTMTHRVVSVRERGEKLAFHTKGDANGKGERWTIAADGTAGHVQVVIPKVGYVLNWVGQPAARFIFLTLASVLLAGLVLARVWGLGPGRS